MADGIHGLALCIPYMNLKMKKGNAFQRYVLGYCNLDLLSFKTHVSCMANQYKFWSNDVLCDFSCHDYWRWGRPKSRVIIWSNKCSKLEKRSNLPNMHERHKWIKEFSSLLQFENTFGGTFEGLKRFDHNIKLHIVSISVCLWFFATLLCLRIFQFFLYGFKFLWSLIVAKIQMCFYFLCGFCDGQRRK